MVVHLITFSHKCFKSQNLKWPCDFHKLSLFLYRTGFMICNITVTVCCHTCAMRIPVTIASWCSVPSAPRRLVGAISPTYIGVRPDAKPAHRKS